MGRGGRYETIIEIINDAEPTVKELLGYLNAGGGHFTLISTPEESVDQREVGVEAVVADGFNLMSNTLPGSLEDIVELIVPEMQKETSTESNTKSILSASIQDNNMN